MSQVDIIIKMVDKTGAAKNSTTANLKSMAATLTAVAAVAVTVGIAMKKAFDLGKEGAMLEFTATKFDRLSESIGTTADVLLKDLRKATGGIYSDMELMASATDMVGLGLANTHDEAVRLAKVSGGLNMNMNQLVLTLTNMTTMRFDALGVRVDGFKEKVKALEDQGYSTNDAFKEAFLQQAEAQLTLVGNAADTTLGSYMRLEAAIKNNTNALKRSFSEGLEPVIKSMADEAEEQNRVRTALEKTNPVLYQQYLVNRNLTSEMKKQITIYDIGISQDEDKAKMVRILSGAINDELILSLEDEKKAMEDLQGANADFITSILDATKAQETFRDKQAGVQDDVNKLLEERAGLYSWETEKIEDIDKKLEGLKDQFTENEEEYKRNWIERMGLMALEAIAISDGVKGFSDAEQKKAIAYLRASGLMTGGAQEQAVAEQILATTIAKSANEDMPYWGEAVKRIMDDGVVQIQEVTDAINNVPSEKTITFYAVKSGSFMEAITGAASANPDRSYFLGGGRAAGGPVSFGTPYMVGERGPEIFVPNSSGNIVPNGRTPNQPMIDYRKMSKAIVQALQQAGG